MGVTADTGVSDARAGVRFGRLWLVAPLLLVLSVLGAWVVTTLFGVSAAASAERVALAQVAGRLNLLQSEAHAALVTGTADGSSAAARLAVEPVSLAGVSGGNASRLAGSLSAYRAALAAEGKALAVGGSAGGLRVHDRLVDPAYQRAISELVSLEHAAMIRAARAKDEADVGTWAGLVGAAVLGALGALRLGRSRAALAASQAGRDALTASEERFRALVRDAADVVVVTDADTRIAYVSDSAGRVLGREPAELIGGRWADLVHPADAAGLEGAVNKLLGHPGADTRVEMRTSHADGSWRWTETTVANRMHTPGVSGMVLTARDVTEQRALTDELAHRALHDPLTGLANRALCMDRLAQALARAARSAASVGVAMVDLDGFKQVNDSLGHAAGDALLVEVAARLRAVLRHADTVARLGGDEFAVVIEAAGTASELTEAMARAVTALSAPATVAGRQVTVGASAGVVIAEPGQPAEATLRRADVALYAAKTQGTGRVVAYEPGMETKAVARIELAADLTRALSESPEQLVLHYQPVVDLVSRRINGVEALVRWDHPIRGLLAPVEFIPLAEETGLIVSLGRHVLTVACAQLGAWDRHPATAGLTMAANVSVRQLADPDLANLLRAAIAAAKVEPARVTLEVTESVLVGDGEAAVAALQRLRAVGVRLAIDDFGTGYSSLAYLHRLPVDLVKIDQSFVRAEGWPNHAEPIVRAVVELSHQLGLRTLAEGVEEDHQAERLRQLGCDEAQGFLFARPLPPDQVAELLENTASRTSASVLS